MRFLIILAVLVGGLSGQDQAIVNVSVYDVEAGAIKQDVVILLKGDRIHAVAPGLSVPDGATTLDAKGATAYPGFIDAWTTLGLNEIPSVQATNDTSEIGKWNAHMRAGAAINPHSAHFPVARCNGITSAAVIPGGGTLPGQAEVLDLFGRTVPKMRITTPATLRVLNLPAPPRRNYSEKEEKDYAKKVEKSWKDVEEQFTQARRLAKVLSTGNQRAGSRVPGQQRLSLRATAEHLDRGAPWLVWANDRDHILAVLDFAKKHELRLVIAGLQDGWKVAERLKDSGHGLLVGSSFSSPDTHDPYDAVFSNAAVMHRAGCRFGIVTNSNSNVRNLPYQAAMSVAYGLPREAALRALTLEPARVLGIEASHGSLEAGKIANLVIYSADPLEASTDPEQVFIRGQRIPLISRHTFLAGPFLKQ